jgi:hypothetical protein
MKSFIIHTPAISTGCFLLFPIIQIILLRVYSRSSCREHSCRRNSREEDGCRGRPGRKQVAKSGIHSMMMDYDRKMPKKPEAATGSCGIFSPA